MTLHELLAGMEGEFALLWGEAPPDSLKGKKGADVLRFIKERERRIIEAVAERDAELVEKVRGMKQEHTTDCPYCDGHPPCEVQIGEERALDAVISLITNRENV